MAKSYMKQVILHVLAVLQLAELVRSQAAVSTTLTQCTIPSSTSFPTAISSASSPSMTVTSATTSSTIARTSLFLSQTSTSSSTATHASGTVTVNAAGGAQFTAINDAIKYAQTYAQPTVLIKVGTYNEAVVIPGAAALTIIGESSSSDDYTQNKVIISNGTLPLSINSNSVQGITFKNINFVNPSTGTAPVVSLRGTKNAFYDCQFITFGTTAITATLGITLIANSYIEGTDKLFYGYLGIYVFNSKIAPTLAGNSANLVYNHGYQTQISQIIFDSCSIIQKSGTTTSYVYLAGPNGDGSQAVYKYTSMAGLIAPPGTRAVGTNGFYGEYANTGAGSYGSNSAYRVDTSMTTSMLSNCTIDYVFAHSFTGYTTPDASWVDPSVYAAIANANTVVMSFSSSAPTMSSSSSNVGSSLTTLTSTSNGSSSGSSDTVSTMSSVPVLLPSSSSMFGATTSSPESPSTTSSTVPSLSASSTYVVSLTPNATEFGSISAAINALPNDGAEKLILVMPGTYTEQLNINRTGKVTVYGFTTYLNDYSQNQVTVQFDCGVSTSANQDELTPVINSKKTDGSGLALYNINFVNTFAQTKNFAALAADFYGANMAAYGCSFVGFQDTLLANKGTHLFSNCYIEGSVDFIWGYSKAYFHQCYIAVNTPGASIAAQSRSSATADGGYVFDSCLVTYTNTYGSAFGLSYLGRPYSSYSVAVYKNSYLDKHINLAGWSVWQTSNPQTDHVLFGEYNNVGPSAWTASTARASFATNLTVEQAAAYDLGTFMGSTSWIDMTAFDYVPSFNFPSTGASIPSSTQTATSAATATPTTSVNATGKHPTNGTSPPAGAILVSVGAAVAESYASLTAALASLPSDSTDQTIFIYPGSYTEQVAVKRAGAVKIIGYQTGNVGQTYTSNQVTITFARGLSVAGTLPAGQSDADTAVISTATDNITFYNVNFVNTGNLDGAVPSYVTLAGSVYGNQVGFYGCSFVGWQDTLLTGSPAGYAYYESSYIEGAIDFIWGYSLSYFKGCTIAAKRAKSCMTAHNRASTSATGGYIFDQCLFTTAADATVDLTQNVYLGRPYSQYARVIIKNSYLDSIIHPAGWKVWSTTDPRTDHVIFAEFQNVGPGNWENNAAARTAFGNCTLLTSDTYTIESVIPSTSWIDFTYWDSIVTPSPASTTSETATSTSSVATATATANSTVAPAGSCVVSKTTIAGLTTYSTITECINSLPAGSTQKTIFIYPGTYDEQLTFSRTGETIFRGYADTPGDYASNQVIITNSIGVDTQADQSNSDSATIYSRGQNVKFYNINLVNTFGTAQDYASLGFAIGNDGNASFYGCQIIGNQDTFDTNSGTSIFAYNTYIEGNVDFIWGAGSMYFLASTISPNEGGDSITADKRATNTSLGGIVFDQCTVTPSTNGSVADGTVSLGRPYNSNARVAYIKTYLDSCISSAGWAEWSTSSPQTDGVFFGEYHNTGPGSDLSDRASFSHEMTDAEAVKFQLGNFFVSTSWIDFSALNISPFSAGNYPVTVTVTVSPTDPPVYITATETFLSVVSEAYSSLVVTKNTTLKVSIAETKTEHNVYKTVTAEQDITSTMTATPAARVTTTTLNDVVHSTVTLSLVPSIITKTTTDKVTATTTVTPAPVTQVETTTEYDLSTSTVTPKVVSKIASTKSETTVTITSSPKVRTTSLKLTLTTILSVTATTPTVKLSSTTTSIISSTKTRTQKGTTTTSTEYITIGAGSTTLTKTGNPSYINVSVYSTITTTKKSTTTLTCTTAHARRAFRRVENMRRDVAASTTRSLSSTQGVNASSTRALVSSQGINATNTSSLSSTLPPVTVTYIIPQSTITVTIPLSTTSTKTLAGTKITITNTVTSYHNRTSTIAGTTYTDTIVATSLVLKTITLPVATSTVTTALQGTVVATIIPKPTTFTTSTTVVSTAKTRTLALAAQTVQSHTTVRSASIATTTLPQSTYLTTTTLISTMTLITTLPTTTITISNLKSTTISKTFTPAAITQISTITKTKTSVTTFTLPALTVTKVKTVTSRVATPTVTITPTSTRTTTLKTTVTDVVVSTKTAKNAPTCA